MGSASTRTATGAFSTSPGTCFGVLLTAGADAAVVTITDGEGGVVLAKLAALAGTSVPWPRAFPFHVGLHLTVDAGTTPSVTVLT